MKKSFLIIMLTILVTAAFGQNYVESFDRGDETFDFNMLVGVAAHDSAPVYKGIEHDLFEEPAFCVP